MGTHFKIKVDRWLGLPAAWLLNVAARILGFLLRPDHSLTRSFRTIVVCKFLGMGSIIQATPLLAALRRQYPHARIIFVTTAAYIPLLKRIDSVSDVFTVDDSSAGKLFISIIRLMSRLWNARAGLYFDLEIYSNFSSIITTLSCARNRVGFYKDSRRYRMGIYSHMMFFNTKAPVSEVYLQMGRLAGCIEPAATLVPPRLDEKDFSGLDPRLVKGNYIVVNPNASGLRIERRWPPEKFRELINRITSELPEVLVAVTGSIDEQPFVSTLLSGLNNQQIVDTSGKLTVYGLMALLERSSLVVTNDSGPMNLSIAFGKKTIALFGPVAPVQYGFHPNVTAFYTNVYCSPCIHEFELPPCKGDNQCMKSIGVDEVFQAVRSVLSGHTFAPAERAVMYSTSVLLGLVKR